MNQCVFEACNDLRCLQETELAAGARKRQLMVCNGEGWQGYGRERALAEGDWMAALADLASEGVGGVGLTGRAASSTGSDGGTARERAREREDSSSLALEAVVERVAQSPVLLNLARMLAYHQRTLSEEALAPRDLDDLQALVRGLSTTLRTILCL